MHTAVSSSIKWNAGRGSVITASPQTPTRQHLAINAGFMLNTAFNESPGRAKHVTHPALGPGRVFVWVTWLALSFIWTKTYRSAFIRRPRDPRCWRLCVCSPSAAVTPARSVQVLQLWPTNSSRLGTRRSRAAITFTARSRTAIITARQWTYVICRALDRMGTSCVRDPETFMHARPMIDGWMNGWWTDIHTCSHLRPSNPCKKLILTLQQQQHTNIIHL